MMLFIFRVRLLCKPNQRRHVSASPETALPCRRWFGLQRRRTRKMNNIIYIVGLIVIVLAILGFLGLR